MECDLNVARHQVNRAAGTYFIDQKVTFNGITKNDFFPYNFFRFILAKHYFTECGAFTSDFYKLQIHD